jgi:hypothetical protein
MTMRERALLDRLRVDGSLKRASFLSKDLIALEALCNSGHATWDREADLILPTLFLVPAAEPQMVLL